MQIYKDLWKKQVIIVINLRFLLKIGISLKKNSNFVADY